MYLETINHNFQYIDERYTWGYIKLKMEQINSTYKARNLIEMFTDQLFQ